MHFKTTVFSIKIKKTKYFNVMADKISLKLLQRTYKEDYPITDDTLFNNYFIVSFPDELGIRYYDVVSTQFLGDNICRFTIRNNFSTFPLYHLHEYKRKNKGIFSPKKDIIEIYQLCDSEMNIIYKNVLTKISIKNIYENMLSYKNDKPQEIVFDIKYRERILTKHATNKEGE